jgi:hypothetical protein
MTVRELLQQLERQMGSTPLGGADPVLAIGSATPEKLAIQRGDCGRVGVGGC